ncbi:MAG: GIY-YIG nuclease family protein [Caulobacter sp.]|nr:GIY-YIG nuclease family protein [Caulobacter sp.]
MSNAYREFEFDLPAALLSRLIAVLDAMNSAPLNQMGLDGVPEAQGVYQLFYDSKLVYIGKTDSEAGLRRRLERHAQKIQHRVGLQPGLVTYKAVRIFVFTAIDLETQLIAHYAKIGGSGWNNSGFGANDPGRKRDHTKIKATNFDALFPIDLDRPLESTFADCDTAGQALARLKLELPYNLRFENDGLSPRRPHPDLANAPVNLGGIAATTRNIVVAVTKALPAGWQATALRSHLLLYKETDETYPDAEILART